MKQTFQQQVEAARQAMLEGRKLRLYCETRRAALRLVDAIEDLCDREGLWHAQYLITVWIEQPVKENPRRPGPFRASRWSSTHHSFDQRDRERTKAKQFWNSLIDSERFELGDQLVLGDFEWRDWLTTPPSHAFLNEVDRLRVYWETVGE